MFIIKAGAIAAALVCVFSGTAAARSGPPPFQAVTVYALGPNDSYVAEYEGTPGQWTIIGGPATYLYAGSAGVFAVSPGSNDIYQYDGTPGEWTEIGGPGSEFAEAGDHLYGLGPGAAYVAEYDGTPGQWSIVDNQKAAIIYGGADGLFAVSLDSNEDVLKYDGTPDEWTNIGFDQVQDIAVGTNCVYAERQDGEDIEQWTSGTGWVGIGSPAHGTVRDLLAGGGGFVVNVPSTATEWEYNGTPGSWSEISTDQQLDVEAVSTDYIYGIKYDQTSAPADVEVYSGTGTQWTIIGGPATPPLAAGD